MARHRGALGPAGLIDERDDPGARGEAAAVGGGASHHPGDVLAGTPALRPDLEQPEFAAVQREGMHRDQRLVRAQFGFRHLADRDRLGSPRGVDDGAHGLPPATR